MKSVEVIRDGKLIKVTTTTGTIVQFSVGALIKVTSPTMNYVGTVMGYNEKSNNLWLGEYCVLVAQHLVP